MQTYVQIIEWKFSDLSSRYFGNNMITIIQYYWQSWMDLQYEPVPLHAMQCITIGNVCAPFAYHFKSFHLCTSPLSLPVPTRWIIMQKGVMHISAQNLSEIVVLHLCTTLDLLPSFVLTFLPLPSREINIDTETRHKYFRVESLENFNVV